MFDLYVESIGLNSLTQYYFFTLPRARGSNAATLSSPLYLATVYRVNS